MCPEACENKAFGKCRKAMRLVSRLHVSYQISIPKLKPKTSTLLFGFFPVVLLYDGNKTIVGISTFIFLSVFKFNILLFFKCKRARFYIGATKINSRLKVGKKILFVAISILAHNKLGLF